METVADISAWAYACAPPLVRDIAIPDERAVAPPPYGADYPASLLVPRGRPSELAGRVRGRMLSDLKGLEPPLFAMRSDPVDGSSGRLISWHRASSWLTDRHCEDIGNGLYVVLPEYALMQMARSLSPARLALLMCEACGIYTLAPQTARVTLVVRDLVDQGVLTPGTVLGGDDYVREFADARGRRVAFADAWGDDLGWRLCFDRLGNPTDLWKRPPLTSHARLEEVVAELRGARGIRTASRALTLSCDGSASPAESRALMMLCGPAREGGEGWPWPSINRRIDFDEQAKRLAGTTYAIADAVWMEQRTILEVNGFGSHADRQGFHEQEGRTAALEHMGFTVLSLTYPQMEDLELFESRTQTLAQRLGFPLKSRTRAFLTRREGLHRELFDGDSGVF